MNKTFYVSNKKMNMKQYVKYIRTYTPDPFVNNKQFVYTLAKMISDIRIYVNQLPKGFNNILNSILINKKKNFTNILNHIRHNCSNYEDLLSIIYSNFPYEIRFESYIVLHNAVNARIAQIYPQLYKVHLNQKYPYDMVVPIK